MSKAILAINMPKNCYECIIGSEQCRKFTGKNADYNLIDKRPDWCPLKELPEKYEVCEEFTYENMWGADEKWAFEHGWNACLKEIL